MVEVLDGQRTLRVLWPTRPRLPLVDRAWPARCSREGRSRGAGRPRAAAGQDWSSRRICLNSLVTVGREVPAPCRSGSEARATRRGTSSSVSAASFAGNRAGAGPFRIFDARRRQARAAVEAAVRPRSPQSRRLLPSRLWVACAPSRRMRSTSCRPWPRRSETRPLRMFSQRLDVVERAGRAARGDATRTYGKPVTVHVEVDPALSAAWSSGWATRVIDGSAAVASLPCARPSSSRRPNTYSRFFSTDQIPRAGKTWRS